MFFLILFSLFHLTYTHKCSLDKTLNYDEIYVCRQKLNLTSIRLWLYIKYNQTNINELKFYLFTLRIIDLVQEDHIHIEDRFEKQISDYIEIKPYQNNTINIHNLAAGRYEICVNFFNKKTSQFFYRSTNSCLHIPWNVPEHIREPPSPVIRVLFIVLIIILFISISFFIHSIHLYWKSRRRQLPIPVPVDIEGTDEEFGSNEHARRLVNQHFSKHDNPFELLVRKRIHQRYAHRSPDLNDDR